MIDQCAEEHGVSAPLSSSEAPGITCDEILAKAAELWPPQCMMVVHHAPGVEGRSGGEVLKDTASPGAYGQSCGHAGLKMQGNPPGDDRRHAAEPRSRTRSN